MSFLALRNNPRVRNFLRTRINLDSKSLYVDTRESGYARAGASGYASAGASGYASARASVRYIIIALRIFPPLFGFCQRFVSDEKSGALNYLSDADSQKEDAKERNI